MCSSINRNDIHETFFVDAKARLDKIKPETPVQQRRHNVTKLFWKVIDNLISFFHCVWWYVTTYPDISFRSVKFEIERSRLQNIFDTLIEELHESHKDKFRSLMENIIGDLVLARNAAKHPRRYRLTQRMQIADFYKYYKENQPSKTSLRQFLIRSLTEEVTELRNANHNHSTRDLLVRIENHNTITKLSYHIFTCRISESAAKKTLHKSA